MTDYKKITKALDKAQEIVKQVNKDNGWFESDRTFGEDIALLHSEVSEMLEAYRDWGKADMTKTKCISHTVDSKGHHCKPEGIGSEAADVLIRLLDTCERVGIDLGYEFKRKIAYNKTRGHRHGGKNL